MLKNWAKKIKAFWAKMKVNSQQGWTTMEYVAGAIAIAGMVTLIIDIFKGKLTDAIGKLVIG